MDMNLIIGILTLITFIGGAVLINAETKREDRQEAKAEKQAKSHAA